MPRPPAPCGTITSYVKGCRCYLCEDAWRDYYENVVRPRRGIKGRRPERVGKGIGGRYPKWKTR